MLSNALKSRCFVVLRELMTQHGFMPVGHSPLSVRLSFATFIGMCEQKGAVPDGVFERVMTYLEYATDDEIRALIENVEVI